MKSKIKIHLVFADQDVIEFDSVVQAYEFLSSHAIWLGLKTSNDIIGKDEIVLTVLSSGLSADDEAFINRQVSLNKEIILGVCDDKIIN